MSDRGMFSQFNSVAGIALGVLRQWVAVRHSPLVVHSLRNVGLGGAQLVQFIYER